MNKPTVIEVQYNTGYNHDLLTPVLSLRIKTKEGKYYGLKQAIEMHHYYMLNDEDDLCCKMQKTLNFPSSDFYKMWNEIEAKLIAAKGKSIKGIYHITNK